MGFDVTENSLITYAIIAVMLIIILALVFHADFRKDMQASDGEVNIAGLSLKGIAPVMIFGLCLFALFKFRSDTPNIDTKTAIEHLTSDTLDHYFLGASLGGTRRPLSARSGRNGAKKEIGVVEFTEPGITVPDTIIKYKTDSQELGIEELLGLANLYSTEKKTRCGDYVFRIFNNRSKEVGNLDRSQQERLALVMKGLSETYYGDTLKVNTLTAYMDRLNNLTPRFKTLRQAEFLYNVALYSNQDEWRFKALAKYFDQHEYANLPEQSKKEVVGLFQLLNTRANRERIENIVGKSSLRSMKKDANSINAVTD